jgi:hypothetical protein
MAVLKFGAIVTEGSGSLGGHTIQNSQGGSQLRTKPIPRGNPSASQILIRSLNPVLQAGWRALTDSQRKIWNNWPVAHGIMNAKGDKSPLSGHSLWMKWQFYMLIHNFPLLLSPDLFIEKGLGPQVIKNNLFSNSSFWTVEDGWTISAFSANCLDIFNQVSIYQIDSDMHYSVITPVPIPYRLSFDLFSPAGAAVLRFLNSEGSELYISTASYYTGHIIRDFNLASSVGGLAIFAYISSAGPFSIKNLKLSRR